MTNLFQNSRQIYFSAPGEGPTGDHSDELAKALKESSEPQKGDKEKERRAKYSVHKVKDMPNNEVVAREAVERAEVEAAMAENLLSELEKEDVAYTAKLGAWREHDERQFIREENPGSKVFTPKEDMPLGEYLAYPGVISAVVGKNMSAGLEAEIDTAGLFPGVENMKIHRGEHLVVAPGGKSIQIVKVDPEKSQIAIVDESVKAVATGERSDEALAQNIDTATGFKMVEGKVQFNTAKDLSERTLGAMFGDKQAIMVDGHLVLFSDEDGEFHRVITNKDGSYSLNAKREYVYNGTRIDEVVDKALVAKIKTNLETKETS